MTVHHRYAVVQGHRLFYREAGQPSAPTLLLLHGYPSSSYMYRNLVPQLCDQYRVIAPDLLGFGYSDAPSASEFNYTFDAEASVVSGLLHELGVHDYSMFVHSHGAEVGWRLALKSPESVSAIVTQAGNGHEAGFNPTYWQPVWDYAKDPNPQTEAALRPRTELPVHHVAVPARCARSQHVSPDTWNHDAPLIARPGNDQIQLALFRDYPSNLAVYNQLHEYFETSRVPLMAIWGNNDEVFGPVGALAFQTDLADAEVHLLDGGHFLVENNLESVTERVRGFLGHKRAAASVALIAGLAAGPIGGAASAARPRAPAPRPATRRSPPRSPMSRRRRRRRGRQPDQRAEQRPADAAGRAVRGRPVKPEPGQVADRQRTRHRQRRQRHAPAAPGRGDRGRHLHAGVQAHNLGNLGDANDHDSLGLFQQRPSSGWGSPSSSPTRTTRRRVPASR